MPEENSGSLTQLQPTGGDPANNLSPKKTKRKFILFFTLGLLIFLIVGSVLGYFIYFKKSIKPSPKIVTNTQSPTTDQNLQNQLGIFKDDNTPYERGHFQAGIFTDGKYKGFKRIVLFYSEGMGENLSYVLATNDDKTYVVDGDPKTKIGDDSDFKKEKVIGFNHLTEGFPQTVNINSQYSLYRRGVSFDGYDSKGMPIYQLPHPAEDKSNKFLPVTDTTLKFYGADPSLPNPEVIDPKHPWFKYIESSTIVQGEDSQGLVFDYILTAPKKIVLYQESISYSDYPNLNFKKLDLNSTQNTYSDYEYAFPGICGGEVTNQVVTNISDGDLTKIGVEDGKDVYALVDNNHPLSKDAFDHKITTNDTFDQGSKSTRPSYNDYIARNPLLFIKDPWNRWIMLGEFDYKMPGGCGKPVIYLYPQKPTQVSLKFTSPMRLTTDIPTYGQNGWNVLAQPNGDLIDLQPKLTDCNLIDGTKFGSEYAKDACLQNKYPYLYWAGSTSNKYPQITQGWYVKKEDLETFMNEKLDEVGLTTKEKSDMLSYWLIKMQKDNAPYYRVSFLQTEEMNKLVPMSMSPKPDTVLRIFLDYLPLSAKPTTSLTPQKLVKVDRVGFVIVEWGGLSR